MTIEFTPEFLDRYTVGEPLGEGGMGTVYRGEQRSLERPVAIKFLSRSLLDEEYLARFRTEAKAAAQIFHSNLVAVIETGTMGDLPFIVFELVAGTSLRTHLTAAGGTLSVQQALDIVRQAADGLACAHKAGIVHRDIKPENLLVAPDGSIKVADFGVAKAQAVPGQKTRTGLIMGTPAYLSPEQAHEKPVTAASDVWALGVVFHELLAGAQPFARANTLELLTAIVSEPPPPLPGAIPAPVADLVSRMLAKDPAERVASMQDVSRECARLIASVGEVAAVPSTGAVAVAAPSGGRTAVVSRSAPVPAGGEVTRPLTSPLAIPAAPRRWPWALLAVLLILGGLNRKARENRKVSRPSPSASVSAAIPERPPTPRPSPEAEEPAREFPMRRRPIFRREGALFETGRQLMARADDPALWEKALGLFRATPVAQLREFACVPSPFNRRTQLCQMWTALSRRRTAEAVALMAETIDQLERADGVHRRRMQDIPVHLARALEVVVHQVISLPRGESVALADACTAKAGTAGLGELLTALKLLTAGGDSIPPARARLAAFRKTAAAADVDPASIAVFDALLLALTFQPGWKATREGEARQALADLVRYVTAWTGSDLRPFALELARGYHAALGGAKIPVLEGQPAELPSGSRMVTLLSLAQTHLSAHHPDAQIHGKDEF